MANVTMTLKIRTFFIKTVQPIMCEKRQFLTIIENLNKHCCQGMCIKGG